MDHRAWHDHYGPIPTSVEIPDLRLDDLLAASARRWTDQVAIHFLGRRISYQRLSREVDRFAAGLQRLGLRPGDRVMVFAPNIPQTIIAAQGIWRAGCVVVPSNPLYSAGELRHQAVDSGARAIVALSAFADTVDQAREGTALEHVILARVKDWMPTPLRLAFTLLRERKDGHRVPHGFDGILMADVAVDDPVVAHGGGPDDVAALMYTGGTTGVPKAAVLTHRNLVANARQTAAWSPGLVEGREVMLTALPLTHAYAMTVCMNHAIARGYTMVLVPDPRDLKRLLRTIHETRPTIFPGVPALYAAIADHPDVRRGAIDLSSISQCLSGAAGLPGDVQRRFQDLTGGRLVEGYGLSEASPVTHANPLDGTDRLGTIGLPIPGTDCRILDEATETEVLGPGERGVLCIAGPQVMREYWNRPDETAEVLVPDEDGTMWLHTGDVAEMDDDGFFRIVDRKKDLILAAGGLNVYPREVEEALYDHPAVFEAGVIGVPPGGTDQRVKAFVVLNEGASATEEELRAFLGERLARFKVPKTIEFTDELPKSFVGKVLRRKLAELEREAHPAT